MLEPQQTNYLLDAVAKVLSSVTVSRAERGIRGVQN
jgi:hypothetical protein